jgi:hypothetical protein
MFTFRSFAYLVKFSPTYFILWCYFTLDCFLGFLFTLFAVSEKNTIFICWFCVLQCWFHLLYLAVLLVCLLCRVSSFSCIRSCHLWIKAVIHFYCYLDVLYSFFFTYLLCLELPVLSWIEGESDILILLLVLEENHSTFYCWLSYYSYYLSSCYIWILLCWLTFLLHLICGNSFLFHVLFLIFCAGRGYIVAFTKILTTYQMYHT